MACRGCSRSGLGLLSRSGTPRILEAKAGSVCATQQTRLISSSSRSIVSSRQRNTQQQSSLVAVPVQSRNLHSSARRSVAAPSPSPKAPEAQNTNTKKEDATDAETKPVGGLAKLLKATVGGNNTYAVYGLTQNWAKFCASQADYTISKEDRKAERVKTTEEGEEIGIGSGGVWHETFHLLPTFATWSQVGMLHMYLLAVRFRALDKESHEKWQKQLVDHFFHEAEAKMDIMHDMGSSSLRQRYLKDLFVQWRGVIFAYDEGLVKGDAVLASAVWRNLFKAREDVDLRALAAIVAWMRNCLKALDRTDDADLPFAVEKLFATRRPSLELHGVDAWSGLIEGVGGVGGVAGSQDVPPAADNVGEAVTGKKSTSRFSST